MTPANENRIIKICKEHNWVLDAPELEMIKKCCEDYNLSMTMEAFERQPMELFNYPKHKKAKEIALEVAKEKFYFTAPLDGSDTDKFLEEADKIYQWLIKE